ncbi:phosphate regulon sensor histidine kinase PhoR [Bordetella sp. FB-8]|uniref:phosphate regulon sensor histidine kinase PhoR n=1 Tax=Bordetella sp. FB-8 TaxID=1159870 RepID=UPI00037587D5|nr:phosphate regulon sensor histidine kinase PhoR [Bordetella sp. FB-8]
MVWLRTLLWCALWAAVGLLAGDLFTPAIGWAVPCLAFFAMLVWRNHSLSRVTRWAQDPTTAPPADVGAWDDVVAPLYRYLRMQSRVLQESHDALQNMVAGAQALPDGVVTLNNEFQIDWCNRMAMRHLGLRLPYDRGSKLLNLVRSPDFVAYAQSADWPEPILVRLSNSGQERVMMMQMARYGQNQHLLISRDVTQIEKLETTRRDFVANVSHELRTPLTVLTGFLETLRDMPQDAVPAEQREQYIGMMYEQAQRMQAIVEDLLTLSTLESSPGAGPAVVNMSELLQRARQQAEALSNGRHVFEWHIDEDLDLLGNASELTSAVSNLLTNAVRYTPDGGQIRVYWETDAQGMAHYRVQDTGIGIAARHIPRLTERFYRVDRGRSRAVGGTGLGLAITKHVAMRHDATLGIESEPGKGSTFSLDFPSERVSRDQA